MMAYKWLLFDLDGTLLDFHKAEYLCMEATLKSFGFRADDEVLHAYRLINESYWKMLERGEISQEALALARHRSLFERFGFCGDVEAFQQHYEGMLSESSYLFDGARELLDQLRDRDGVHLAIVTNGFARIQERRIALAGLDTYFEWVFISEQVGYRKPQVEFFDHVFREICGDNREDGAGAGFTSNWKNDKPQRVPSESHSDLAICKYHSLIIGDSLTSDIKGGADFGIATCWFNPDGLANTTGVRVDHEIRTLDDIHQLVG
ncbi:MAG: HAD family hydrolase [Clostridia bacterium]|nr:HAD family hydrolase [Clostridia bacterium]